VKVRAGGGRRKGHDYERRLAAELREVMPGAEVHRGIQSRDGAEAADVVCPVFHVEAKRQRRPNIVSALNQAIADAPDGKYALAVTKADRREALVTMRWADFKDFIEEWWEATRK